MSIHWGGRGAGHVSRWSLAPTGSPTLALNFLSGALDSRITFTRTSTATFVGSNGTIQSSAINEPRFDYNPVTLQLKGLLIEEQRTNLLLYSQQIDNATWTKLRATVTANSTTSPDGTSNADTLLDTAVAGTHIAIQLITKAASALTYAFTIYLKKDVRDRGEIRMSDQAGNGVRCTFNLTTGVVGTAAAFGVGFVAGSSQITNAGNGWYRLTLIGTTNAVVTLGSEVYIADASGNLSYTGTGAGFFVWGAQLEQASFATSYIPTVAATVTRTIDQCRIVAPDFAPWYNASAGTLLIEALLSPDVDSGAGNYYATISDGAITNSMHIVDVNGTISQVITGGVTQFSQTVGAEPTGILKAALAYASNNTVSSANGAIGATDTSVSIPTVNRLSIGSNASLGSPLNGHIRAITYYNTRLLNAQLQALTQ